MTAQELIEEVLRLDAEFDDPKNLFEHQKCDDINDILALRAGTLARMLKLAIEQRNIIHQTLIESFERVGIGTNLIKQFAPLESANAELDRIASEK